MYVSRALDMHLLLFHEMAQAESSTVVADYKFRRGGDAVVDKFGGTASQIKPPPRGTPASSPSAAEKHFSGSSLSSRPTKEEQQDDNEKHTEGGGSTHGGSNDLAGGDADVGRSPVVGGGGGGEAATAASSRSTLSAEGGTGTGGSGGSGYRGESSGPDGRSASATTGKNGRFATSGRVREFRAVLKGAAAHASKMKVCATEATFSRVHTTTRATRRDSTKYFVRLAWSGALYLSRKNEVTKNAMSAPIV